MMTIEDIKKKKKEFGYSNQQIAKKSGVPLGTVNKIFSGMTKVPRYETLLALEKVFRPVLTPEDPDSYAPKYAAPHPYQFARLHRDDSAIAEAAPAYAYSRKRDNDLPVEQVAERWPNQGNYTVEDYFNLPDDIRAELIDGRFYIMNVPSYIHQEILGQLYVQFQDCIRKHPGRCRVYFSPMNVQLDGDDRTMVQPDLIVICVKYGALPEAVQITRQIADDHTIILCPMNGVDTEERIAQQMGKAHILHSLMYIASERSGNQIHIHDGVDPCIHFGRAEGYGDPSCTDDASDEDLRLVRELFETTGIHHQYRKNIITAMWNKYALNISTNIAQAITGCCYGSYKTSPFMNRLGLLLCEEVHEVARQKGITCTFDFQHTLDTIGTNDSARFSTLQDLMARRETEVDMFCGAVMRMGKECGVRTPYNEFAYLTIKALEEKNKGLIS